MEERENGRSAMSFRNMVPTKKPLNTKNISTPVKPKYVKQKLLAAVDMGNTKEVCANNTRSIAIHRNMSNPNSLSFVSTPISNKIYQRLKFRIYISAKND